jgi:hypothetical protein
MIYTIEDVEIKLLKLTSSAFNDNEEIPVKYTCDGLNQSPSFDIENIPLESKCLAIIVEDPDAPINTWVHWLVWNIPVTHHIQENTSKGINGLNDFSRKFYCGPCPMSGTHHYLFKVYALNELLHLSENAKKNELERAMSNKIIAFGQLTGIYSRK